MTLTAWIIIGIVLYLLIGIGILTYVVLTDPYGGLVLHFGLLVILGYPYLIIRSFISNRK